MPGLAHRLDLLHALSRSQRSRALLGSIPHADPDERDAFVGRLLDSIGESRRSGSSHRQRAAADHLLTQLLHRWSWLSRDARRAVITCIGDDINPLLNRLRASHDGDDHRAAAFLAVACLIGEGPRADAASNRSAASGALETAAPGGKLWHDIDAVLAEAAEEFPSVRHQGLMDVIAYVMHAAGPRLRTWLEDREQPGHMALRSAARSVGNAQSAEMCVRWLALPAVRRVTLDHIAGACERGHESLVLSSAHLLGARARTSALRDERADRVVPSGAAFDRLDTVARINGVRWLAATTPNRSSDVSRATRLLADPDAGVRVRALGLIDRGDASRERDQLLADFALDADDRVANRAATRLALADHDGRRQWLVPTMQTLARSPHAGVRASACAFIQREDEHHEPIALRRALQRDREATLARLDQRLLGRDPDDALLTLSLVARLGIANDLEQAVLHLARHEAHDEPSRRVRSKAVLLAGRLTSDDATQALTEALDVNDARVRANAVEALGARRTPLDDDVRGDDVARVRANAVHAWLRARPHTTREHDAREALSPMLSDERAEHRRSGLWVTRRIGCTEVAGPIADLARHDRDPDVRDAARTTARSLLARMRAGWSRPSSEPALIDQRRSA
ncbi:MAG: hypothetical protein AAGD00_06410 [Planctomycetota bacterium]